MNPLLKENLDKLCLELAQKHAVSEKLVNICIQVNIVVSKLGVIHTFAKSPHINVQQSIELLNDDVSNIVAIAGSLAGIEDATKLMAVYQETNQRVMPLLQTIYASAANEGGKKAS